MVILFLLALLLAWPTFGLSLVAYIIFVMFQSHLAARSRIHYANQQSASRAIAAGEERMPSWARDRNEREIFVKTIHYGAMRSGVPKEFLGTFLTDEDAFGVLVHFAGAMEHRGATFIEQQVAVTEKLVEIWKSIQGQERPIAKKHAHSDPDDDIPW
ncbi:hypothetical protein [Pararhodobacter sp.]|uniref:hypothetical protein n=1 Tax=Pararhodobacter sp. TaxID=2127056 RepID=UPI002FDE69FD